MRSPGDHMGVCQDGTFAGSLSGGCIEGAVVAEALDALKQGSARKVRFGKGSPYIDIRLPCGGGVDVHFQPLFDGDLIDKCVRAIARRQPFYLSHCGTELVFQDKAQKAQQSFVHWPLPRLNIVGHGAGVLSLAKLATSMGIETHSFTPDPVVLEAVTEAGLHGTKLEKTSDTQALRSDAWTAFAFLFHDHDWEIELMRHTLALPHFYLGAMGSMKAHAMRVAALQHVGVSGDAIASIQAPIGLFHSSRDPDSLALATLGEITVSYHQYCAGLDRD